MTFKAEPPPNKAAEVTKLGYLS